MVYRHRNTNLQLFAHLLTFLTCFSDCGVVRYLGVVGGLAVLGVEKRGGIGLAPTTSWIFEEEDC